ncbi:Uncharacterised protein [uncultured Clostridium sp.]|nr:Uncharacterised protein [uncultured Clostridium sp.]
MSLNIFNIWESIGRKIPFAVRRTHWANKSIYVIVDRVEPDGKGYGKAYGIPTENGGFCSYWQTDKKWKESRLIPNNGVYGWEYVEGVTLEINANLTKAKLETKEIKKPINSIYDVETTIGFGKYRNFEVCDVIDINPNYLIWAIQNIDKFKLSEKAINELSKKIILKDSIIQINNRK